MVPLNFTRALEEIRLLIRIVKIKRNPKLLVKKIYIRFLTRKHDCVTYLKFFFMLAVKAWHQYGHSCTYQTCFMLPMLIEAPQGGDLRLAVPREKKVKVRYLTYLRSGSVERSPSWRLPAFLLSRVWRPEVSSRAWKPASFPRRRASFWRFDRLFGFSSLGNRLRLLFGSIVSNNTNPFQLTLI